MQIPVINQNTWRLYQGINVTILVLTVLVPAALVMLRLGGSNEVAWTKQFLAPATGVALLVLLVLLLCQALAKKEVVAPAPDTPVKLVLNLDPADYEKTYLARAPFGGHYLEFRENDRPVTREISSRALPELLPVALASQWTVETRPTPTSFLKKPPKHFLKAAAGLLFLAS